MAWFKGDDKLPRNPKILAAESAAECWFYVCCLAHCAESLTDGFIAESAVPIIAPHIEQPRETAERLVELQLLERVAGGYMVPDYLSYNPSREQVIAKREKDSSRQAQHRESRTVSRRDSRGTSGVTPRVPSRPVPDGVVLPSSSSDSTANEPSEDDEHAIAAVLDALADAKQQRMSPPPRSPSSWRRKVKANDRAEHGDAIAALVAEYPDAPPSMLAARILGENTPHLALYRAEPSRLPNPQEPAA